MMVGIESVPPPTVIVIVPVVVATAQDMSP
jgi:hypothetical protein